MREDAPLLNVVAQRCKHSRLFVVDVHSISVRDEKSRTRQCMTKRQYCAYAAHCTARQRKVAEVLLEGGDQPSSQDLTGGGARTLMFGAVTTEVCFATTPGESLEGKMGVENPLVLSSPSSADSLSADSPPSLLDFENIEAYRFMVFLMFAEMDGDDGEERASL
jgi:hypothetical protein